MAQLERQIRATQHRLWFNRWLRDLSRLLAIAAAIFAAVVLIQRLYDLPIPSLWIAALLGCCGVAASVFWTVVDREEAGLAAAMLDEAAGLRERLSSAHYCCADDDPFARAVVVDAERISESLSARRHIRLVMPPSIGLTAVTMLVASLMFFVPVGLLTASEAEEDRERTVELEQAKVAVKRQMDQVREMVEANPVLDDLKEELGSVDKEAGGRLTQPVDIRHEAVKKIDSLADAVKRKRRHLKYDAVRDTRRLLRGLDVPKSPGAPTQKLSKALARGDFKTAREEINALREQLATLKSEKDQELAAKIGKQLDELAKQLRQLSKSERLAQKLQQAGLKKEDVMRMLENLKKEDLDQVRKQLEEKGFSQQEIKKLAKQLQRDQQAGSAAKRLAQAIKQGAASANPGQMGEAMAGLSMAADQLSELELLEQEMNQLDTVLADLQGSMDRIDRPCSDCKGRGCGRCQRPGPGRGGLGRGRGGLAPEERTAVRFKTERGKVHTGKGAIIGQFLFDGEQVKGEVTSSFTEVISAAEHDASDRISRNRIPRQYQKAVKAYFSNVQRSIRDAKVTQTEPRRSGNGSTTDTSEPPRNNDNEE